MNKKQLIGKVERLIEKEEREAERTVEFYRSKSTGRLTREGMAIASFRNHTIQKMKEILKLIKQLN